MSKRTPQYEKFIALVNVPDSIEEEKKVKNYWLIVNILKAVTICVLILVIVSIVFDTAFEGIIEIVAVICLMI